MEPSTFDWKEAAKLWSEGVKLEIHYGTSWCELEDEDFVHFNLGRLYRRAPVEVKEETVEALKAKNHELRVFQEGLINECVALREQLRVKEEKNKEYSEDIRYMDTLCDDQEVKITRLHDSLNEERGKVDKAREALVWAKDVIELKGRTFTEYRFSNCLAAINKALDATESGEKTLNSKEELSSSLHDAPSGEVKAVKMWRDTFNGKLYKDAGSAPANSHLEKVLVPQIKQEESESSAEECLEWLFNHECRRIKFADAYEIILKGSVRSYAGKTILEAIRSAMISEVSK